MERFHIAMAWFRLGWQRSEASFFLMGDVLVGIGLCVGIHRCLGDFAGVILYGGFWSRIVN